MSRHILDTPVQRRTSGMKLTLSRIAFGTVPRRETLILQRRPVARTNNTRLREYARIERGYMA